MSLDNGYLTISAAKGLDQDTEGEEDRQVHSERALRRRLPAGRSMWATA